MTSSDGAGVHKLREKLKPTSFLFCALCILYISTERVLILYSSEKVQQALNPDFVKSCTMKIHQSKRNRASQEVQNLSNQPIQDVHNTSNL